jgi:predicted TIM-barrel fold metal-dependent hydrolase
MIVDCHTQTWDANAHLGAAGAAMIEEAVHADAARHLEAVDPVDRAIVLAFKSNYLQAEISNRYVSEYVHKYSSKLIGFAGIDPTEDSWLDELGIAQQELGLKGVTVSPGLQNFHPADTHAMELYAECMRRGMPVLFQQDHRSAAAKLEYARPLLLDEVAREFPELRIVVSHLGYPWIHETVVVLAKHANVFADVAGLLRHPWLSYNALMPAYEYGVMEKLLFGSDFPYRSPAECIEALYSVNQVSAGTNLIAIPRQKLRGIVERDALSLLGIEQPAPPRSKPQIPALVDDD